MIFFLIIFFYVIGVLICGVLLLCAVNDRYENELVYIVTTYNDILGQEIEKIKLKKDNKYKPYDITKHTEFRYNNHNYHEVIV